MTGAMLDSNLLSSCSGWVPSSSDLLPQDFLSTAAAVFKKFPSWRCVKKNSEIVWLSADEDLQAV